MLWKWQLRNCGVLVLGTRAYFFCRVFSLKTTLQQKESDNVTGITMYQTCYS